MLRFIFPLALIHYYYGRYINGITGTQSLSLSKKYSWFHV